MAMNCVRCEIVQAKLRAMLYINMRWPVERLVNDLNEHKRGVYFTVRHPEGADVYRRNNNPKAEAILIWKFKAN